MKTFTKQLPTFPKYSKNVRSETALPLVISYLRWSSAIQGDGDSERRQEAEREAFLQEKGWPLAPDNILTDAGVSAFRGKNLQDGALGAFLKAAQEGKFPDGTVLLVEALDRLTRMEPEQALQILLNIIGAGIVVITLMDREEYRTGHMDPWKLFKVIMIMSTANEESQKKSDRLSKSWEGRFKRMEETGKVATGNLPGWLALDPATGKAVVIEDKAAVVQSMYDMCIQGHGMPRIAKILNDAAIPSFSMEKRSKGRAEYWTLAGVAYVLKSPAVYGEFYSPKLDRSFPDHFPAIVSKDDFFRAKAAKTARLNIAKGQKGRNISNLFSGVAKCSDCGEPMTIRQGSIGRGPKLYCKATLHGKCKNRHWNYDAFESNFLCLVNELDMVEIVHGGTGSRVNEITAKLQSLVGEKADVEGRINDATKAWDKASSAAKPIFEKKVDVFAAELETINAHISELQAEWFTIQEQQRASGETKHWKFSDDEEERLVQRTKAAHHIRTLVDVILMTKHQPGKFATYTVQFNGGGSRTVVVNFAKPTEVVAVQNDDDQNTILPADKHTALDLMKHLISETANTTKAMLEAGDYESGNEAFAMMQDMIADIRQR